MKFEFAFFAGHGFFYEDSSAVFLALTVKEPCLFFLPNPCATSCFVLHIFRMRFPSGIFMRFVGRCEIFL
jgi:hypothetical protein